MPSWHNHFSTNQCEKNGNKTSDPFDHYEVHTTIRSEIQGHTFLGENLAYQTQNLQNDSGHLPVQVGHVYGKRNKTLH